MPQLQEDEWPAEGEPTTAEEEHGSFKREGPHPPQGPRPAAPDRTRGAVDAEAAETERRGPESYDAKSHDAETRQTP